MTNDEALQAAKDAGIEFKPLPSDLYCEAWLEQLEHLAAIIEKRTIERCAVVCDGFANSHNDQQMIAAMNCAAAIRAME